MHNYKVAFIGSPGCGKTSTAQAVQVEMSKHSFTVSTCFEYAREYIQKYGGVEHVAVQSSIGYKQKRREEILQASCDLLISDSPLFFCYIYALLMVDPKSKPQLKILRDLYKWFVLDVIHTYDAVIYLPKQFDVVDDGVREPDKHDDIELAITGFISLHRHLFKNFVEIYSDCEDPKEILHDRAKKIKKYLSKIIDD